MRSRYIGIPPKREVAGVQIERTRNGHIAAVRCGHFEELPADPSIAIPDQFKEHIGLYALVFVSALTEIISESFKLDLVSVFFWILHSLSMIAMLICSFVIIVLYFRRNLLKDEGYLMNTLPVEPWMLYVSKFLTAFVLFILDLIVAVLSFSIINHGFAAKRKQSEF